jgi:hypothetical protein
VHHDDIAVFERRNQALLDIGQERLCVHGPVNHHRGDHFIVPQGGHESLTSNPLGIPPIQIGRETL